MTHNLSHGENGMENKKEECEDFARREVRPGDFGGRPLVLNYWPSSQICMDCEHGVFIVEEPASTYACNKGMQLGPCASSCLSFEKLTDRRLFCGEDV